MRRLARLALVAALGASLVGGGAVAQDLRERYRKISDREFDERVRRADPSKVIAAELAFARAAQEKGQWTAFADFATDDAVMFVPQPVNAREWLRKQQNPAQAVRWQPHQVWSSCDGTLAVTRGAWQRPDGSTGYFTTVWQRTRKGEYKWVMDQGDVLTEALAAPEMIGSATADCRGRPDPADLPSGDAANRRGGLSGDGTLYWSVEVAADGGRTVTVGLWQEGAMTTVLDETVAAGG